jgi:hypothetical protein
VYKFYEVSVEMSRLLLVCLHVRLQVSLHFQFQHNYIFCQHLSYDVSNIKFVFELSYSEGQETGKNETGKKQKEIGSHKKERKKAVTIYTVVYIIYRVSP